MKGHKVEEPNDYEKQIERYKQMRLNQRVQREQYEHDMKYMQAQLNIQIKLIAKLYDIIETLKPSQSAAKCPELVKEC